jgi:hypothetical protein
MIVVVVGAPHVRGTVSVVISLVIVTKQIAHYFGRLRTQVGGQASSGCGALLCSAYSVVHVVDAFLVMMIAE